MWVFLGFCIYIGRKWFGLRVGNWDGKWVKVLILVRFDDIGCDIDWINYRASKSTDFLDNS